MPGQEPEGLRFTNPLQGHGSDAVRTPAVDAGERRAKAAQAAPKGVHIELAPSMLASVTACRVWGRGEGEGEGELEVPRF